MGIFNFKIFEELGENIKKMASENVEKDKTPNLKCSSCGANVDVSSSKETIACPYCGTKNKNPNYSKTKSFLFDDKDEKQGELTTQKYFVLVEKDDECGFFAYDIQTDSQSDVHSSVAEALEDIKEQIEECVEDEIDEGEMQFEFWTEEQLLQKKAVQKRVNKGARIKPVDICYHKPVDFDKDPNW